MFKIRQIINIFKKNIHDENEVTNKSTQYKLVIFIKERNDSFNLWFKNNFEDFEVFNECYLLTFNDSEEAISFQKTFDKAIIEFKNSTLIENIDKEWLSQSYDIISSYLGNIILSSEEITLDLLTENKNILINDKIKNKDLCIVELQSYLNNNLIDKDQLLQKTIDDFDKYTNFFKTKEEVEIYVLNVFNIIKDSNFKKRAYDLIKLSNYANDFDLKIRESNNLNGVYTLDNDFFNFFKYDNNLTTKLMYKEPDLSCFDLLEETTNMQTEESFISYNKEYAPFQSITEYFSDALSFIDRVYKDCLFNERSLQEDGTYKVECGRINVHLISHLSLYLTLLESKKMINSIIELSYIINEDNFLSEFEDKLANENWIEES